MVREAINETTVPFLLTAEADIALATLMREDLGEVATLARIASLRREFSAEEAGALLALARLRHKAEAKFPCADQLFYTAEALEQATAWPIATKRAAQFAELAPPGPILDLGCGIGGDLLALATLPPTFGPIIGIERDQARLQLAQANIDVLGLRHRVQLLEADWVALLHSGQLPYATAAFADPARRVDGHRRFSLHQIAPPLSELLALQQQISALGVKVMPGVRDDELPPKCGVEFISHDGICKEAVLWFDRLAVHKRWASVHTAAGWHELVADEEPVPLGEISPGTYLHEPDPAIIRGSALGRLCADLDGHLFDRQIAYLVSAKYQPHPLVQSFRIDEIHPFQLKLLNRRLQALDIGQVELKKRGFPIAPEELRPRLKFVEAGRAAVVIFTRRGNERIMLIGERVGT